MNRRILLRRSANKDLDGHFLFISEDSVEASLRFYEAAIKAFEHLTRTPEIGVPRASLNRKLSSLRMWPIPGFSSYLIFYCRTDDGIDVVRVLHAKRDIERILKDE